MFRQLISHTEAYKAVIGKWPEGTGDQALDSSSVGNLSPTPYPKRPNFENCVADQFYALKNLQQQLQNQLIGSFQPLKEQIPAECSYVDEEQFG